MPNGGVVRLLKMLTYCNMLRFSSAHALPLNMSYPPETASTAQIIRNQFSKPPLVPP